MPMHVKPSAMAKHKPELHGIVLKSHANLNVVDYLKSLSLIVNPKSVISFGKVAGNNYGVFFTNEQDRDKVLETEIVKVNNIQINVQEYAPAVKTVFLKGVPLLENEQPITDFMSKFGTIKTKPMRLPLKDVPEGFEHVLSHTLVLKMVLNEDTVLPNYTKIDVGSDVIKVKIEHGFKKCFQCGERGHEKKLCPYNIEIFPEVNGKASQINGSKSPPPISEQNISNETQVNQLTDLAAENSDMQTSENGWRTPSGKRKKLDRGQTSDRANVSEGEIVSESAESSPSNEAKAPKLISTETRLLDSFNDWKHLNIGNGHLQNDKLLQFLVSGSKNISEITSILPKFSNKPSLLRKQLNALIGKVQDEDVKRYIKELSDAIPINLPS